MLCAFIILILVGRWYRLINGVLFSFLADLCKISYAKIPIFIGQIISLSWLIIVFFAEQYIKVIIEYAVAKRLGIIDFFNKHNFFLSFLIVCIVEFFILLQPGWYNHYDKVWESGWEHMLGNFVFCDGFMNVFILYKFARFLSNKFPKKFSFLKKFYPKFLDKIQTIFALGFISIISIPYGIYLFNYYSGKINKINQMNDCGSFVYSTEVLLGIIVVVFLYRVFKLIHKNSK